MFGVAADYLPRDTTKTDSRKKRRFNRIHRNVIGCFSARCMNVLCDKIPYQQKGVICFCWGIRNVCRMGDLVKYFIVFLLHIISVDRSVALLEQKASA